MVDSDSTNKNYSDADNSLAIREEAPKYLPSTEVRELVPQLNDEIDLRDLLNTLLRRKTLILSIMAAVFLLAALYTFLVTPLFKAKGVVRASAQNSTITKFENLENNVPENARVSTDPDQPAEEQPVGQPGHREA